MKINLKERLKAFVSANAGADIFQFPDVAVNAALIKAIMINEVVPPNPADDFYGGHNPPGYLRAIRPLFAKAGLEAASVDDITKAGIYLTNAVKIPKSETAVAKGLIERSLPLLEYEIGLFPNLGALPGRRLSPLLEYEIGLFPNLKVIMLMGDVAKKAFNMLAKKKTGKNAVPSPPTYKLRNSELYYGDLRILPSYIMTGGNILIEKSKVEMAAGDIQKMLTIIK